LNNNIEYATVDTLDPNKELLIAMPFPFYGDVHPDMTQILDTAYELNIPVHIDGAWISCIRDIEFNFDHPAIQTVGISLSKGGMGGNRIGLRFARSTPEGAVTIMNDFNMNSQATVSMGIKFMEELGPEYFWNSYSKAYAQVLKDFNLQPTKAIHLARQNGRPVGVRPLLRCLQK
jgi:alanine-alpha-ketoisovalerate/valine-pyruvate aminotransferase